MEQDKVKQAVLLAVDEGKTYDEIETLLKGGEFTEEEVKAGLILAEAKIDDKNRRLAYELFNV